MEPERKEHFLYSLGFRSTEDGRLHSVRCICGFETKEHKLERMARLELEDHIDANKDWLDNIVD
jgi:hypothetical protein